MGVWVIIGVSLAFKFGVTLIPVTSALLLGVYFILGYLLFAGIFVCIGAPVTTEQEAQQLTSYVSIVLVLPIMLALPAMQDPHSGLVTFLTYFPLTTPTMMAMRIPVNVPSLVEIVISMALLAIASLTVMWASGKIFRVAVLSYGKRPGIGELLRYLRA
jgi:ABC-2 type transport system permease protein